MGTKIMHRIITNYHTHTNFCDGKDTAEKMAESAYNKGVSILGFSSHSMYPFSSSWHIDTKDFTNYCAEVQKLKTEYKGKMEILLGFEAEFIPGVTCPTHGDSRASCSSLPRSVVLAAEHLSRCVS